MNKGNTFQLEQNWQTYRSKLNDKFAIFSVNLALKEVFPVEEDTFVVQFSIPYLAEENGLPLSDQYPDLIAQILKSLTQLSALPHTYYAGHILCNANTQIYFYTKDITAFRETLSTLGYEIHLQAQKDSNWDLYFDFLLPSSLELRLNETEETIHYLLQHGYDLSEKFTLEHRFTFVDKENMFHFIEKLSLSSLNFLTLKYTDERISLNEELEVYLVKLVQELHLNNSDIFDFVENFDQLAQQCLGLYMGWVWEEMFTGNILN